MSDGDTHGVEHSTADNPGDRRTFLVASGALIAAAFTGVRPANATIPSTTEGIFVVLQQGQDRIFFIPSVWMEAFEITDLYRNTPYTARQVVQAIRESENVEKIKRALVLYGDNADIPNPTGADELLTPAYEENKTYIAAMTTPGAVPG